MSTSDKPRSGRPAIPVTIYSDVICPWCYVGKKRPVGQAEKDGLAGQSAVVSRLFQAYFKEGLDIGSKDVLLRIARETGMYPRRAREALEGDESRRAVLEFENSGLRMGIRGVPFFLLIGKYGLSGAQSAELWCDALPRIVAEAGAAA